jgi:hypothetical protein
VGEDPFLGIDDMSLLHGHAGIIAAMVMAQANQMRVLDSAIVPDRDLVRPTEAPTGKFNELAVYTPTTPPEKYVVFNELGEDEVVVPSEPFYPGLGERGNADQSAISLALDEASEDPYKIALATGTALLQIGVEAGFDVGPVAEILNKAWGLDSGFSPGTIVGLEGASDYAALFSQDRGTNARRLASWQECSTVRSGQLTMATSDWGPNLHCDFRRVRVAAESLFATSRKMEARPGRALPSGKITYHVPATSLLSADPQYLFFNAARPEKLAKQAQCAAVSSTLESIATHGLLRTLWPSTEPRIAATWTDSFATPGGVALVATEFIARPLTGGTLFSVATSTLVRATKSLAGGLGNTVMTEISAKLATLAEGTVSTKDVGWLARFAAVIEIMRLTPDSSGRIDIAKNAWPSLRGDLPRTLEKHLTTSRMAALRRNLPAQLKASVPARSAKIPVWALLLELGNPKTGREHTVLRGLRRAFGRSREVAMGANVAARSKWLNQSGPFWVSKQIEVLREFWAVQYAALSQVVHLATHLRSDVRWWVEVSAAVNLFRAGVMRGMRVDPHVASESLTGAADALVLKAYHSAAALASNLAPYMATPIPTFGPNACLEAWANVLGTVTAPIVSMNQVNLPRAATSAPVTSSAYHYARGAMLLATESGLSDWIAATMRSVADDCDALSAQYGQATTTVSQAVASTTSPEMAERMAKAVAVMAASMEAIITAPPPSEYLAVVESEVSDDAWDDFLVATMDPAHPLMAEATQMLADAKACPDEETARTIARWINANFQEEEEAGGAALL